MLTFPIWQPVSVWLNFYRPLHFHFNFLPLHAASIFIITVSLRGYRLLIKLYWVIIQHCHFCLIGWHACNCGLTPLSWALQVSCCFLSPAASHSLPQQRIVGKIAGVNDKVKENKGEGMRRRRKRVAKEREGARGVSATHYPRHERLIRLIDPA